MADRSGNRKPIYVVDDSGSEENDDDRNNGGDVTEIVSADRHRQSWRRRPRGGAGATSAAFASAAAGNSVVDLTSDSTPAAAAFASTGASAAADEEVQFLGSSSLSSPSATAAAAAAASERDQLAKYRADMAESFVQFAGSTKRDRPVDAAYAAASSSGAGPIDRYDADRYDLTSGIGGFGRFGDGGGLGSAHQQQHPGFRRHSSSAAESDLDLDWLPEVAPRRVRHSTGQIGGGFGGTGRRRSSPSKGRKKKRTESPPPPLPMEKGKAMLLPTGFDALDMYYPHLKAADRTAVLYRLLPEGYTKKWTHDWRVAFEKEHPKPTLWSLAAALSDEITGGAHESGKDLDSKTLPARTRKGKENHKPTKYSRSSGKYGVPVFPPSESGEDEKKVECALPTESIGPLSGAVIDNLRTYFRAHVGRIRHKALLDAIEPVDGESSAGGGGGGGGGGALTCSVCADDFDPTNAVPCTGEDELHFFCKTCFSSYATVTVQSGPIQSITCPMPGCSSLFATADAKAVLSDWDLLMIEHREESRDRRVALAAKAVLHCECGAVAIITEEDVGNGRVACPGDGCGRRYCCKCGNDDHGTEPCPPPAETVQWLDEHSKECPNCKNRIQKNGGCDHMTCSPPGGCGYEFWWTCGCPYKGQHRPECKRLGERQLG